MLDVLFVTIPFFALVLLGYMATRSRLMPVSAIPGLNTFVLYFALPCMLFRFGADTPIAKLLDVGVLLVYLSVALVMVAFTVAVTLAPRTRWDDAALGALVVAFPNTGFMGVPLLGALLGVQAIAPAIITIVIDIVITSSVCVALSRLGAKDAQGQPVGALTSLAKAFKGMATNPMPWAIVLGALFSATDYQLAGPMAKVVQLLGDAASPVALFTMGTVLARQAVKAQDRKAHRSAPVHRNAGFGEVIFLALLKLFLHPALVLLVGVFAKQQGIALSDAVLTAIVLVAALPSASNVSLLSERFGANTERVAHIILVSTVIAFFSFSAAVAVLKA